MGRWKDDILNDFIDIIASDDYTKKKTYFYKYEEPTKWCHL